MWITPYTRWTEFRNLKFFLSGSTTCSLISRIFGVKTGLSCNRFVKHDKTNIPLDGGVFILLQIHESAAWMRCTLNLPRHQIIFLTRAPCHGRDPYQVITKGLWSVFKLTHQYTFEGVGLIWMPQFYWNYMTNYHFLSNGIHLPLPCLSRSNNSHQQKATK